MGAGAQLAASPATRHSGRVIGDDLRAQLRHRLPGDHSHQVLAEDYIERLSAPAARVLDLGCGMGDSIEQFRDVEPSVRWLGVDLDWSPEVARRVRIDAEFASFDGVHLPAPDASIDAVYCKQVLEHVRDVGALLCDVTRVLRPGGLFAGSTSQLEPYHSLSLANLTPYGLLVMLEAVGLELVEVRPGIDALTLMLHRGFGMPQFSRRWWGKESPLNRLIELFGRLRQLDCAQRNAIKLIFCAQYSFLARRPPG